jgi:predicted dehydrogenase
VTPRVNVGVVGCGKISGAYFGGCGGFDIVRIIACADLDRAAAQQQAARFGVPKVCDVDELLADADVELVLNLTVPRAHAPINRAALQAGKHAYTEKPFAVTLDEARAVLELARASQRRVGSAPDTFLGGGIQTCRRLIDDGAIGAPVAAVAFTLGRGHEYWHPSPAFYYQPGGGPMFDMGPYYLTALVTLIGPLTRVSGSTKTTFPERLIRSEPLAGQRIRVEVPTHYTGLMDFECGATGTIITSFDVAGGHNLPRIEIYGTEGSLSVPDPNTFRGPVRLRRAGQQDWTEIPLTHSDQVGRGIGVADMAVAIRSGRAHRASGELAAHVLEVMNAFEISSQTGRHVHIQTRCERPAPLPAGLEPGQLDP